MKLFKFKKKTSILGNTLVDVRSHSGFKNHLITHSQYLISGEALCGSTQWLHRSEELEDSPWVIRDVSSLSSEYYCSNCLKNARSA